MKNSNTVIQSAKPGAMEYIMSPQMAESLLQLRKGEEKKLTPQQFLVKYVNETFGLLYNCVKVTIS